MKQIALRVVQKLIVKFDPDASALGLAMKLRIKSKQKIEIFLNQLFCFSLLYDHLPIPHDLGGCQNQK